MGGGGKNHAGRVNGKKRQFVTHPSKKRLVSGSQNITEQVNGLSRKQSTPETLNWDFDRLLAPKVFSASETLTRSAVPVSVITTLTIIFGVTLSGIAVVVFAIVVGF